jgi:hypothetical protein
MGIFELRQHLWGHRNIGCKNRTVSGTTVLIDTLCEIEGTRIRDAKQSCSVNIQFIYLAGWFAGWLVEHAVA